MIRKNDQIMVEKLKANDQLCIIYYDKEVGRMKATTSVEKWLESYHNHEEFVPDGSTKIYSARIIGKKDELARANSTTLDELFAFIEQNLEGAKDSIAIEDKASDLSVVKLGEKKGRVEDMAKGEKKEQNNAKEPSITAILKGYSEVTIKPNGLMISFESKEDILEAFKALTEALDKADKERLAEEMGFGEEQK